MNEWEWVEEVRLKPTSVDEIKHFLNKPFKIYDSETFDVFEHDGVVDDVYWIEDVEESPKFYNVCWYQCYGLDDCVVRKKTYTTYTSEDIVKYFNNPNIWVWMFND